MREFWEHCHKKAKALASVALSRGEIEQAQRYLLISQYCTIRLQKIIISNLMDKRLYYS